MEIIEQGQIQGLDSVPIDTPSIGQPLFREATQKIISSKIC